MNGAIDQVWPQKPGSNYCGVEDAIALDNYDNLVSGQSERFTSNDNQVTLGNTNQDAAFAPDMVGPPAGMSQWGWGAGPGNPLNSPNKYGGHTNIAPDYGTDPRSVAWMIWNYSLPNRFFHDHIYSWHQDANGNSLTREDQVQHATTLLGRAIGNYSEPVIAFINGGLHAVVVSGLWSGNDIYANYPADIQGLVYRDPEGTPWTNEVRSEIEYSLWVNGHYWTFNTYYSLWSLFYGDASYPNGGGNNNDPEPTVGPYVPGVRYPTHWWGNLNWVQRDNNYANGLWNPDYAFAATFNGVL
jgi:hypothetical protein